MLTPEEQARLDKRRKGGIWVNDNWMPVPPGAKVMIPLRTVFEVSYIEMGSKVLKDTDGLAKRTVEDDSLSGLKVYIVSTGTGEDGDEWDLEGIFSTHKLASEFASYVRVGSVPSVSWRKIDDPELLAKIRKKED